MLKVIFLVLFVLKDSEAVIHSIDDDPINTIFHNYNKYARASTDDTPVNVTYSMSIKRIVGFDTKRLVVHAWKVMTWKDPRLVWNGGPSTVRLPPSEIWTPDIVCYNNPITTSTYEPNAMVRRNGAVHYVPVTKLDTDDCKFVSDIIECKFKVGSWTYNGNELRVEATSETIDMDNYIPNDVYEIVNSKVKRNVTKYACCPEPYITLDYILHLKPKQQFQHWFPWS
ncbi:Hypothetical predicted protein [Mytilus galloprovincialis]|uniref:Neurotransmitter-gated ion-channel ligand-binding domain-containing protein n=1 Tax=Mytilus galloprovincialis TaxID=29158 RepID=A0A8B6BXS3_MYTGA|nr:Hypothetical predicted protein [Mytilus galloprovincialis]